MRTIFELEAAGPGRVRLLVHKSDGTVTRRTSRVSGKLDSLRRITAEALRAALEDAACDERDERARGK